MSELTNKIAELKIKYAKLSKGINDEIVELDAAEYEATIKQWAEFELNPTPSGVPIPRL